MALSPTSGIASIAGNEMELWLCVEIYGGIRFAVDCCPTACCLATHCGIVVGLLARESDMLIIESAETDGTGATM